MINSRIIHKHDTEANWNKATGFSPLQGEIIVYDKDENYNYERFKIGDGITIAKNLPFANFSGKWEDIEGKPFTKQNVSILPNDFSWTNRGDSYTYNFTENIPLKDGKQYKVIVNEEQYNCTAKYIYEADEEIIYLGNGDIGGFGESSTEPFFITANYMLTQDFELYSLEIYEADGTDIINEESIPDTIARIDDINWDDLKNKPFGEESSFIFPSKELEYVPWETGFDSDAGLTYGVFDFYTSLSFIPGKTYVVKYNDQSWECTASNSWTLGQEPNSVPSMDDMEYPFYIVFESDAEQTTVYLCDVFDGLPEDFGVYALNITTLDEKFIPDTIARVDDIQEGITITDVDNRINEKVDFTYLDEKLSEETLISRKAFAELAITDDLRTYGVVNKAARDSDFDILELQGLTNTSVRIRGLAAGAENTDAVNVKQLNDAIADAKSYIDETILGGAW